jgi:hypothetical protein
MTRSASRARLKLASIILYTARSIAADYTVSGLF